MKFVEWLKWGGTAFVLSGILLTNLNLYPLNILVHGTGSLGWMLAGIITNDRALTVNFGHANAAFRAWLCENGWADLAR